MDPMKNASESDLIKESQKGEREAFAELYHRYKAKMVNYLYGYVGNLAVAQDIAQEVFIRAYRSIGGYTDLGKFSSWLYSIATNLGKNYLTREKRYDDSLDKELGDDDITLKDIIPSGGADPEEELIHKDTGDLIRETLNGLPDIYKEVLLLVDSEGLSYSQAAQALGCKEGTVCSRLIEARKKFRDLYMKKEGK